MNTAPKGFALIPVLVGVLVIAGFIASEYYLGAQKPAQVNLVESTIEAGTFYVGTGSTSQTVIDKIGEDLNPNPQVIRMEIRIVEGNYSTGTYSYDITKYSGPPADRFIALKQNGKWQVVLHGNGFFDCTEIAAYNIPWVISGGCVDKTGTLVMPQ